MLVRIRIKVKDNSLKLTNVLFYYEELDHTDKLMNEIKADYSYIEKITSSHLKGEVTVSEERPLVVMSLPYDPAWQVKVDNKKIEINRAAGMLLSFNADEGRHSIEMRYIPKGRFAGNTISLVVLLLVIYYMLWSRKKIK